MQFTIKLRAIKPRWSILHEYIEDRLHFPKTIAFIFCLSKLSADPDVKYHIMLHFRWPSLFVEVPVKGFPVPMIDFLVYVEWDNKWSRVNFVTI